MQKIRYFFKNLTQLSILLQPLFLPPPDYRLPPISTNFPHILGEVSNGDNDGSFPGVGSRVNRGRDFEFQVIDPNGAVLGEQEHGVVSVPG